MKRSKVNEIIAEAAGFFNSFSFKLPPFADYSPDEMQAHKSGPIVSARLGWDITDYGVGKFDEMGLVLFTLRNGSLGDLKKGMGMCYAEKLMISRHNQISPMHRHTAKTEDIINRGGAGLAIQMYESDADGRLDKQKDVEVWCDGVLKTFKAGDIMVLQPGQSVTLYPGNWHKFWGEGGDVLIGEVSTVNDDVTDNIFIQKIGRFSDIEEDVPPTHLLVSDYESWLQ